MFERSIKGYNEATKDGKEAAVEFCQNWQRLIRRDSLELAQNMTAKKIELAFYNKKRKELNDETKNLNDCIKSLNKRFS